MTGSNASSAALTCGPRVGVVPLRRPEELECEALNTVAKAFIGYRPSAATAAATSVFYLRLGQRVAEELGLHGLATEQALRLPHAHFKFAHFRSVDGRLVRSDGCRASFSHEAPPSVGQIRRRAVAPGETVLLGAKLSSVIRSFCSAEQNRARAVQMVITPIR